MSIESLRVDRAWSWRCQSVHTTTLYKPTKCQNVQVGERVKGLVGGSCRELTVSNWCQIWVTLERGDVGTGSHKDSQRAPGLTTLFGKQISLSRPFSTASMCRSVVMRSLKRLSHAAWSG